MMGDLQGLREPIFVVGPARSGTSHLAMLLYTRFGVCMGNPQWIGNSWPEHDWRTTTGSWERMTIGGLSLGILKRAVQRHDLIDALKELQYIYQHKPWGVKHPNLLMLLELIVEHFPDAWYIYCSRDPMETAESMKRIYGTGEPFELEEYLLGVKKKIAIANAVLPSVERKTIIDLSAYKTHGEEAIVEGLSRFLELPILDEPLEIPAPYRRHGLHGGITEGRTDLPAS